MSTPGRTAPLPDGDERTAIVDAVLGWYAEAARDLPWRRPEATPWAVMVSEFMLQQTPVARVLGPWQSWTERWPTPADLASEPPGEAVRAWGRLGYPRRALRLHRAAGAIVERHGGQVPSALEELLALPGVGSYTAAAIASFAYGRRHVVLDTNVRRVLSRVATGVAFQAATPNRAEVALAESFVPAEQQRAARWAVGSMELGALICTARSPRCTACPIAEHCRWRAAGSPLPDQPRRGQAYAGTDRQCRGVLLAVLRAATGPVEAGVLDAGWPDAPQRARALQSLIDDGLAVVLPGGRVALPS